jgi:hypothetical protein
MPSEPSQNDVRSLWQSQAVIEPEVRMEDLRERAEEWRQRARKEGRVWYGRAAFCFVFCALNLMAMRHPVLDRFSAALWFAFALGLIRRGRQVSKQIGPRGFAPEIVMRSCLEMYRKELENERAFHPRAWEFLAIALVIGSLSLLPQVEQAFATVFRNPALWMKVTPFVVILLIWAVGMLVGRTRSQRLRQELDEINALMKEEK